MAVGVAHFLATVGALNVSFSAGWDNFETGAPESRIDRWSEASYSVLSWPLVSCCSGTLSKLFPGFLGYAVFAANSALWMSPLLAVATAFRWNAQTRTG